MTTDAPGPWVPLYEAAVARGYSLNLAGRWVLIGYHRFERPEDYLNHTGAELEGMIPYFGPKCRELHDHMRTRDQSAD